MGDSTSVEWDYIDKGQEEIKKMFKEYLNQYRFEITEGSGKNGICYDGAVNPEKYFTQEKRLMVLLKETNGNNMDGTKNEVVSDWNYMDWVQKQARGDVPLYRSIFRNIVMWAKMFELYSNRSNPKQQDFFNDGELNLSQEMKLALENIAIINLKKSWGVERTNWNDMKCYLEDGIRREILNKQIQDLKPNTVLCGGTFDFAHMIWGNNCTIKREETRNGKSVEFFFSDDIIFIKCYHPSRPGWSRIDSFEYMNEIFSLLL